MTNIILLLFKKKKKKELKDLNYEKNFEFIQRQLIDYILVNLNVLLCCLILKADFWRMNLSLWDFLGD